MEKLKSSFEDHLHHGIPASDILEKTVSFFSSKKALIFPSGYSRCSRELLRLSPSPDQDVTPLFWSERPSQTDLRIKTSQALDLNWSYVLAHLPRRKIALVCLFSLDFFPPKDKVIADFVNARISSQVVHWLWCTLACGNRAFRYNVFFSWRRMYYTVWPCSLLEDMHAKKNFISFLKIQCIIWLLLWWFFLIRCEKLA